MSTEVFVLLYSLAVWRIVPNFHWALSDQKGMSYLAKKNSLMKRAYKDHNSFSTKKKCKASLIPAPGVMTSLTLMFIIIKQSGRGIGKKKGN
jgi:uncharacterized membrane protein YbaN (DUF454 family)